MAPQSVPPPLPPSVEEAYRRKCVQLKSRTNDVEEANDAARLRLARAKRQVEKLRVERAFLLEQLAKRTSTNVEDSDGSPSPPPTPKDKPLRIKRGHRKTDQEPKDAPSASQDRNPADGSPAPSDNGGDNGGESTKARDTNGVKKSNKVSVRDAFDLYSEKERPVLEDKAKDSDINVDEELERGWKELPESEKEEYRTKVYDEAKSSKSAKSTKSAASSPKKDDKSQDDKADARDEDVEMKNYDTEDPEQPEDPEPQIEKDEED